MKFNESEIKRPTQLVTSAREPFYKRMQDMEKKARAVKKMKEEENKKFNIKQFFVKENSLENSPASGAKL